MNIEELLQNPIFAKAIDKIVEDRLVRSKETKQSDEIAKRLCSEKPKDIISGLLMSGYTSEDAIKKVDSMYTEVNIFNHLGIQKQKNLCNTYGQFYQHIKLNNINTSDIKDVGDELFFEWKNLPLIPLEKVCKA